MATKATIGTLDQRVTFQQKTTADDGQGGRENPVWSNILNTPVMWAKIDQANGAEGEFAEYRTANEYPIEVVIRNRRDLTETMSLVWRGRRYNIRSILPHNYRREFLVIAAVGGVPV